MTTNFLKYKLLYNEELRSDLVKCCIMCYVYTRNNLVHTKPDELTVMAIQAEDNLYKVIIVYNLQILKNLILRQRGINQAVALLIF